MRWEPWAASAVLRRERGQMNKIYLRMPLVGEKVIECLPNDLKIPKALEIAQILSSGLVNWVSFVNSAQHLSINDGKENVIAETIVFDAEIEIPQIFKYEIARVERIAVTFFLNDRTYPKAYALREDFPDVLHLNLEEFEFPRSLCIFEEPYSEVKLKWTAVGFIERIRRWLADAASGNLHRDDQPVENLLLGTNIPLVLPSKVFSSDNSASLNLEVYFYKWDRNFIFVAQEAGLINEKNQLNKERGKRYSFISVTGSPQPQAKMRQIPKNLYELNDFLKTSKIDFISELRQKIKRLARPQEVLQSGLIVMISLPITRDIESPVEKIEVRAFVCLDDSDHFSTLKNIGEKIGIWATTNGEVGELIPPDDTKSGEEINLLMLNPCSTLSRENAPLFSGTKPRISNKITAVGLGALGSQVFLNLVKAADGEWTLIDKDVLLPHNHVRHASYGLTIGYPKTEIMAHFANTTIESPNIAKFIVADVLDPNEKESEIDNSLSESEVILDCSASVAVARHLGIDAKSNARRISLFLNPTGTDVILLAEDVERKIPLDILEMQYYRLITNTEELQDHLSSPKAQIRYLAGCREVTSQISPDAVAQCAAIGSRSLRQILNQKDAAIFLWKISDDGQVRKYSAPPSPVITQQINDWTIRTDENLMQKLGKSRKDKLPNETGGTLIGSYDMQRKIIYVVDTILSPADSIEKPTSFIRGSYGLKPMVDKIKQITFDNLQNIGEWHSHPSGYSSNPSENDKKLLTSLKNDLQQDGRPALMLIVGEHSDTWHIS